MGKQKLILEVISTRDYILSGTREDYKSRYPWEHYLKSQNEVLRDVAGQVGKGYLGKTPVELIVMPSSKINKKFINSLQCLVEANNLILKFKGREVAAGDSVDL